MDCASLGADLASIETMAHTSRNTRLPSRKAEAKTRQSLRRRAARKVPGPKVYAWRMRKLRLVKRMFDMRGYPIQYHLCFCSYETTLDDIPCFAVLVVSLIYIYLSGMWRIESQTELTEPSAVPVVGSLFRVAIVMAANPHVATTATMQCGP